MKAYTYFPVVARRIAVRRRQTIIPRRRTTVLRRGMKYRSNGSFTLERRCKATTFLDEMQILFMIIRKDTTSKTASRSPLNNRGCVVPPALAPTVYRPWKGHPSFCSGTLSECCPSMTGNPQVLWTLRLLSEDGFTVLMLRLRVIFFFGFRVLGGENCRRIRLSYLPDSSRRYFYWLYSNQIH